MTFRLRAYWAILGMLPSLAMVTSALAAEIPVSPGTGSLAAAVEAAAAGDTLLLQDGTYAGSVVIDKAISIEGRAASRIDAGGSGTALKIVASGVSVRGVTLTGSGTKGENFDSGIYVEQGADHVRIENTHVDGNLFGIVLHGPEDALVRGNVITNRSDLWMNDRGNGIHIWNTKMSTVEGNTISGGRDGIYIEVSNRNRLLGNRLEGLRFAIHYMYANDNEISDNISIRNHVGFALMYSKGIKVLRNISIADLQHGLLLHTTHGSEAAGNYIYGTGEKCLFIYTSTRNAIHDNRFESCGIGVHFTGGSENNAFFANAFLNNEMQVKYTGLKVYEWSRERRGNFWSDNPAFDLDGDGISDTAYRPNTLVDWVLWKYPLAKLLVSSPALSTLRFVQEQLPTLYPGGAVDSFSLIVPPPPPVALPAGVGLSPAPRDPAAAGREDRPIM